MVIARSTKALAGVSNASRPISDPRAGRSICLVTAYRNYISRFADGLGVQLDDPHDLLDEKYRQALKG